jgi:hypothetical protein
LYPQPQVSRIKERVEEKEGIPPVQQRLIFGGKQMYVMIVFFFSFSFFRLDCFVLRDEKLIDVFNLVVQGR